MARILADLVERTIDKVRVSIARNAWNHDRGNDPARMPENSHDSCKSPLRSVRRISILNHAGAKGAIRSDRTGGDRYHRREEIADPANSRLPSRRNLGTFSVLVSPYVRMDDSSFLRLSSRKRNGFDDRSNGFRLVSDDSREFTTIYANFRT